AVTPTPSGWVSSGSVGSSSTPARSWSASGAPGSTPATWWAAAGTTPCSRWRPDGSCSPTAVAAGRSASSPRTDPARPGPVSGPGRPEPARRARSAPVPGGGRMTTFVDRVTLHLQAGDGGNGCVSVRREKFKPLGGPDGGNGGRGGDIVFEVDPGMHTLLDFHFRPHLRAPNGRPGAGSHKAGADGEDLVVRVPDGTVVQTPDGEVLADLVGAGTRYVAARGGRGGRGNAALATARRRVPGFAELGEPGERRDVVLELKSVADVGLVGFPSAGKSSLISVMSAARPTIADYPFATRVASLGVVRVDGTSFVVADVPGLIPGAATGEGLGLEFLRHVERCAVLVHVVDCATPDPSRDPVGDIEAIEAELAAYGRLADRPRLVALNKIDIPDGREIAQMVRPELEARGLRVFPVSAA